MSHTIMKRVAAGVLTAGAVAGMTLAVPGAAFAASSAADAAGSTSTVPPSSPRCTPSLFSQAQQAVQAALTARVTQLDALQSAAGDTANHLTAGDRQTLQTDITTTEIPGIQALQPQVQQATTCPQLRAAARAMVIDYRVYMVMTPQTHLTVVADDETFIEGQFTAFEPTIAQAITAAQHAGKNVTAAQAAFTDLKNQVATAQSATTGQDTTVLAQTPQGVPGNWQVFLAARTDLTNARNDLHTAYADARQIRSDLQ